MNHPIEQTSASKASVSTFSVLLIAEETSILLPYLNRLFKNIYISHSRHESLAFFYDHPIDLVILDIDSTLYDWLDLVNQFRAKVYDIPVALILDLTQRKDLDQVITAGVTQCILKPFNATQLKLSLADLINKMQYKKDAKESYYLTSKRRINTIAIATIDEVIQGIPAPIFAYNALEQVLFYNKALSELFMHKDLFIPPTVHVWDIEELFENIDKSLHFTNIREGKSLDLKYYYKDRDIKKIFIPTKFKVKLETADEPYFIVFLTDIAPLLMQIQVMSYQQQKMDSYQEMIEELLARKVFKESSKALVHTPKTLEKQREKAQLEVSTSPAKAMDAHNYVLHMSSQAYDSIHQLIRTEIDLVSALQSFKNASTKMDLDKISSLFEIYGERIRELDVFIDLGNALCSLSDFMYELHEEDIKKHTSLCIHLLKTLSGHLSQWRISIFEDQSAKDIHYLDSAILRSVLQFQITLSHTTNPTEIPELF